MNLMRTPTLLLNASYEAIRIVTARRALTLITKGKAVVEVDTDKMIYPGVYLPSVIRLRTYRHVPVRFQVVSRKNILLRDGGRCMYCGQKLKNQDVTLDHVIPRSRGGASSWENLVACCKADNHRKSDKLPEEVGMKLIRRPLPQTIHTGRWILRTLGEEEPLWRKYLYY